MMVRFSRRRCGSNPVAPALQHQTNYTRSSRSQKPAIAWRGDALVLAKSVACAGIDLIEYLHTIASTLRWIERTREP